MDIFTTILGIMIPTFVLILIYVLPSLVTRIVARAPMESDEAKKKARLFLLVLYVALTLAIFFAMLRYPELTFEMNLLYSAMFNAIFALIAYPISLFVLRFRKKRADKC
jgi:hypothetical protein